jgi:hypothetical protein
LPSALRQTLYFREKATIVQNMLIQSDTPCRLELYHTATGRLMGVDAEGDGQFFTAGDFLAPPFDADENGLLDVTLDAQHAVEDLEILSLPQDSSQATYHIRSYLAQPDSRGAGQWILQSLNRVEMQP